MPHLSPAALEEMLKMSRREGWIQAMIESGPRPTTDEQAKHFETYYRTRAEIVIP